MDSQIAFLRDNILFTVKGFLAKHTGKFTCHCLTGGSLALDVVMMMITILIIMNFTILLVCDTARYSEGRKFEYQSEIDCNE